MIPSSVITIAANSERLMCDGFSLGETVHLGNFEFIADYFGGLSLFPRRGDSGVAIMGSTRSGAPSPWWVMIEGSDEEFLMVSSAEGALASPLPGGTTRGLCLLPSQLHYGWRMLWPLRPQRRFHRGRWHRGLILASLLCNATLIRRAASASPCPATHR
jgi:hypothetical protein